MNRSDAGKKGYEKTEFILKQRSLEKLARIRAEYEANPKFCLHCGTEIPFEGRRTKFCDRSCAASYNNVGINRHANRPKPDGGECANCGKSKTKKHNRYCDECIEKRVYNTAQTLEEATDQRSKKRILLEQRGHRCEVCGFSEWNGQPITIELDHIDGNADNNSAENLRLICPNCHSQTPTYKGANVGKDSSRQKMRRKRYANGQTY